MDYDLERQYFVEKIMDFVEALEEKVTDLEAIDENRVVFKINKRPFEVLAYISEDSDMICITTRTADLPVSRFDEAVKFLQANLETCWEYCVAVWPVDARYDLSMALFADGFTFGAFESTIYNLLACAEAIERRHPRK
ncbi:MAG: hypothetical protein N3A38_00510 [Planctomycetota bacterium]|nr:hypothetical protein [Planctomycetota bacterium]